MANFTAADVKKLRDLTGSGMMDCKKALEEADGDFAQAVELLRVRGAKDVEKRAGRTAANGLVAHAGTALIELNSETDFVAKNDEFQGLARTVVEYAAEHRPADLPSLLASALPDGRTVQAAIEELSAKIGEKLVLGRYGILDGDVATYLHRKSADLPAQVGVMVQYRGGDAAAARDAAMQVAAMRPRYVSRDEVPEDVVTTERRIAEQTAREEGKPEAALPKIVEGRVNGFFKESVLLEQPSVRESKKTVGQVLTDAGVTVDRFVRFEVGRE